MSQILRVLSEALGLGLEARQLTSVHIVLRAVVVFLSATLMVRFGGKRFMGKSTALDVLLGIMFGSLMSRGISGNAPFGPVLAGGLALVIFHWLLSMLAFHSHGFGTVVKGKPRILIHEGKLIHENARNERVTLDDLAEALRLHGRTADLSQIREAWLERDGRISLLLRPLKDFPPAMQS